MKIFENLTKIEDSSNFGKNWRFLKIWWKLKIFKILIKLEDYSNFVKIEDFWKFCQNRRYLKILVKSKIFGNLVKIEDFWKFWSNHYPVIIKTGVLPCLHQSLRLANSWFFWEYRRLRESLSEIDRLIHCEEYISI